MTDPRPTEIPVTSEKEIDAIADELVEQSESVGHDGSEVPAPEGDIGEDGGAARLEGDGGAAEPLSTGAIVDSLNAISGQLVELDNRLGAVDDRAKHREKVIDRLHDENQRLKAGGARLILDPVVTSLIRLHRLIYDEVERVDSLESEVSTSPAVLRAFGSEVELLLDGCGIEQFTAAVGDEVRSGEHQISRIVDTDDPALNRTIAAVLSRGFRDRHTDRPRVAVKVAAYRLAVPVEATGGVLEAPASLTEDDTNGQDQRAVPEADIEEGASN